jgi:hypothetical protein
MNAQRIRRARSLVGIAMTGWLLLLAVAPVRTGLAAASEEGFVAIFDGKTLEGWDGNPKFWRVEDGAITGQTTRDNPTSLNTFIIWRKGQPADFDLRFEYRIEGGNSGVQFRSYEMPKVARWVMGGYQYDIDAPDQWTGGIYAERDRGIICIRGQKTVLGEDHKPKVVGAIGDRDELKKLIKKGDWNEGGILARDNHFTLTLNGKVTCEMTDEDKEMRRDDGLIALQLHAGAPMKVQFRNLRLKVFDPEKPASQSGRAK